MDFIFVERWGGLGNQLFQYAAAVAVALKYQSVMLISKEKNNTHNIFKHNYALLFEFGIETEYTSSDILKIPGAILFSPYGFQPWNPRELTLPVVLQGYFQYYPAIEHILPVLCKSLSAKLEDRRTRVKEKYSISDKDIFIHVRRGDYVEKSHIHYLQEQEYYENAYRLLVEKLGYQPTQVLIISDDIEWCKAQEWLSSLHFAVFIDEPDELNALALMSLIKAGAIIANSTFSWWGAIFNPSSCVVYPKKWIHPMLGKEIELFPPQWHGL